ncbi:MAG: BRCT domain-containing protein [Nannocystaceae bacterium]|nr:BRCT domain-containing protein [Nannocystaceae bacterium]
MSAACLVYGNPVALLDCSTTESKRSLVVGFTGPGRLNSEDDPPTRMGIIAETPVGFSVDRERLFDGKHHFSVASVDGAIQSLKARLARENPIPATTPAREPESKPTTLDSCKPSESSGPELWIECADWHTSHTWHLELRFSRTPNADERQDLIRAHHGWIGTSQGLFSAGSDGAWWSGAWAILSVEHLEFECSDDIEERDALDQLSGLAWALHHTVPLAEAVFLECRSHDDPESPSDGPAHPGELRGLLESADGVYDRSRDEDLAAYARDAASTTASARRTKAAKASPQRGSLVSTQLRFDTAAQDLEPRSVSFDPRARKHSLQTAWARPMPSGRFFALLAQSGGYAPGIVGPEGTRDLGLGHAPSWNFSWCPKGEELFLGKGVQPYLVNVASAQVEALPKQPGSVRGLARCASGILIHHATASGYALALYVRKKSKWSLAHRTTCSHLAFVGASPERDLVVGVLEQTDALHPSVLLHVASDGLRPLGTSRFRVQSLWETEARLVWMSHKKDLDMLYGFATNRSELWLRMRRGLLVTPSGLDASVEASLSAPATGDLTSVAFADFAADGDGKPPGGTNFYEAGPPAPTPQPAASDTKATLDGSTYLFTGTLVSVNRNEANALVLEHGGKVAKSVTKALGVLVVGAGRGAKSSKEKKAEALVAAGVEIEVLSEHEFLTRIGKTPGK